MITVNLASTKYVLNKETKTIMLSERDVRFGTEYKLQSPSGVEKTFTLSHSTGPEFSPTTRWVYKSEDGLVLEVCNDAVMTELASESYLKAKLRNMGAQ